MYLALSSQKALGAEKEEVVAALVEDELVAEVEPEPAGQGQASHASLAPDAAGAQQAAGEGGERDAGPIRARTR